MISKCPVRDPYPKDWTYELAEKHLIWLSEYKDDFKYTKEDVLSHQEFLNDDLYR